MKRLTVITLFASLAVNAQQQVLNLGSVPGDGTGDTARDGGDKINDNFTELYDWKDAHEVAVDPHSVYLTEAEADALYDAIGGAAAAQAASQPLDATLTALAGLNNTAGLLEQTGADTFTRRAIGVSAGTDIPTRSDADTRYAAASHGIHVTDGDKGDVTLGSSATTFTVDNAAITLAKMANLAQDQFIGRTTASTGVPETATITSAARTVLDDTSTANMLTTLGGQSLDATLTALAGLNSTAGIVEQTGADAFTKRALGVAASTDILTRADGDGRFGPIAVDYLVGTANGSLTGEIAVGTSPGGELGGTWASPTLDDSVTVDGWALGASTATTASANDNDTSLATTAFVQAEIDDGDLLSDNCTLENDATPIPDSCVGDGSDAGAAGGAPADADFLVGTANGGLSAEIVVGTSPGGELGGTWASPTIDDSLAVSSWTLTSPTFAAGSASANSWPKLISGTVLTTAEDGAVEIDADALYLTTDAGNRGYIGGWHIIRANANRTLPNDTNENAIFNDPTNGRLTLETGQYEFEGMLYVTGMSSTSGNALVDILGAGTATCTHWIWQAWGIDNNTPTNAGTQTGSFTITQQSVASIATAGTGTGLAVSIHGQVKVTGAGTIIPSIDQVTAAAATLTAGSYIKMRRIGGTSLVSVGQWD